MHLAPTPFFADRGCHIRIEGIVRCLDKLGFDSTVCTYHHGREVPTVVTRRIKPIKQYTQTEAGPSKYKLWADWKLLWLGLKTYRSLRPQVIHAHLHEGLMIGFIIKLFFFWRHTPLIADMQGSLYGELESHGTFVKRPLLRAPVKLIERILMWCADHIVCSSVHSYQKIRQEFNVPEHKITLVQDGANTPAKLDTTQRAALIANWNLPANKTLAVYSGALLEAKGLDNLSTLILQTQDISTLHFLIIGYPTEKLQQFLDKHALSDRCTLTGQVPFETLPELLQLADIAIDPKSADAGEGSGKMLNYLANRLPVLAFNTQNNRDFLPPSNPLADSITALIEQLRAHCYQVEGLSTIGEVNFKHFVDHYSWSVTEAQLGTAYRRYFSEITSTV
ncbi:glycoside hydrolase [Arenicella chitinivorans]|uniref:Glycoside hydrolase n=2 Tax=Arenicella chitinivorans TaxID=1329800 RepID=A0A918VKP2_9GAMM|nr:glycoside hydrolase [Arenicella chitinivorans]